MNWLEKKRPGSEEIVDNSFDVDPRPIGRGGFSEVYYADKDDGTEWAIKVTKEGASDQKERDRRLKKEGHMMAEYGPQDHILPAEVKTVKIKGKERVGVMMPYVDGDNFLQNKVEKSRRPMSKEEMKKIGMGCAIALDALARDGRAHNDFGPDQVAVTEDGEGFVTDFSLTGELYNDVLDSLEWKDGNPGTMAYAPPEKFLSNYSKKPPGERGDQYALGETMYFMATGNHRFDPREYRGKYGDNWKLEMAKDKLYTDGINLKNDSRLDQMFPDSEQIKHRVAKQIKDSRDALWEKLDDAGWSIDDISKYEEGIHKATHAQIGGKKKYTTNVEMIKQMFE